MPSVRKAQGRTNLSAYLPPNRPTWRTGRPRSRSGRRERPGRAGITGATRTPSLPPRADPASRMSPDLSVPPWPGRSSENASRDSAFSRTIFSGPLTSRSDTASEIPRRCARLPEASLHASEVRSSGSQPLVKCPTKPAQGPVSPPERPHVNRRPESGCCRPSKRPGLGFSPPPGCSPPSRLLKLSGRQGRPSADGSPQPSSMTSPFIRTDCRVAHVGRSHAWH